jgi:Rod binding domain-containing protein
MMDPLTTMAPLMAPDTPKPKGDEKPDAGKQIEVLFARMMIKEMRKAMPSEGPFGGKEMSMFMDLLDDELAARMAESGNMGIADQMNRTLNAKDGSHLRSDNSPISLLPSQRPTHMLPHVHTHDHKHLPQTDI